MASSLWTEWKVGKDICDEIASMASRELLETDSTTAEISTFKENTSSSDRHAQNPTADNTAKMAASSIALPHLPLFVFGDLDYCEEEEAKKRRAGGEGWKRDVFQFALCVSHGLCLFSLNIVKMRKGAEVGSDEGKMIPRPVWKSSADMSFDLLL